jgi:hypothetical protein
MAQLAKVLSDHSSGAQSDSGLKGLERSILEGFTIAFDAFSAATTLWTCCMQLGAEIAARDAQALTKHQAAKSKRSHARKGRAIGRHSNNRVPTRPVRRVAVV